MNESTEGNRQKTLFVPFLKLPFTLNVLVFVLGIGSQKPTVLLLIWLMFFLQQAFLDTMGKVLGHIFFIYTTFITIIKVRKKADRENVWYGSQNRAWLQIKFGRTTPVVTMISASES